MYKQQREFIVTIRYNSDNNHPKDWNIDNLVWLEHGEAAEVISIEQVKGKEAE